MLLGAENLSWRSREKLGNFAATSWAMQPTDGNEYEKESQAA